MSTCGSPLFKMFLDRANIQELILRAPTSQGGALLTDLTHVTQVDLIVNGYTIDSSVSPTAIWWDDTVTRTVTVDGADQSFTGNAVKIQAGPELSTAGLTAGEYDDCCLVIYDTSHTEGTVFADNIIVDASSSCGA